MIAARDHLGRETVLKRDQSGRVVQLDQKDGRKWEFSYDTKGRVVRRKGDNKDDTFTYGPTGRLESVTDALGRPMFSVAPRLLNTRSFRKAVALAQSLLDPRKQPRPTAR
jgi:YD repeat-containing protein